VRPDRFIAWRSLAGASEPRAALAAAFTQILARSAGTLPEVPVSQGTSPLPFAAGRAGA
jgi:hypothetical protein